LFDSARIGYFVIISTKQAAENVGLERVGEGTSLPVPLDSLFFVIPNRFSVSRVFPQPAKEESPLLLRI
jgi:hypothetical protein